MQLRIQLGGNKRKTKNTTHNSRERSRERERQNPIPVTHVCIIAHHPGLVSALL